MASSTLSLPPLSRSQQRLGYRKVVEKAAVAGVTACAGFTAFLLLLILGYIVYKGGSYINWTFLTSLPTPAGEPGGGVVHAIAGSLIVVGLATAIAVPIGVGSALFVNEFPSPVLGRFVRGLADILTAVPSIVVGIFVYELVVAPIGHFSGYSGSIAYAFIMIPIILVTSQEALRLVPKSLREASLALGVPKWRTTLSIVLPVSTRALGTGILLAFARAIGETAPMLFTSFGNQFWNLDPNKPIATLPLVIYRYAVGPYDDWHAQAWAGAFILVLLVLVVSIMTRFVLRRRFEE